MATDFTLTRIVDTRTDADSPITEELFQDVVSNNFHNNALIRSDGTAIYKGAIDSDPTNVSSSAVIDSGPTGGAIANVKVGMVYEVTSGTAKGNLSTINQIGVGSSRLTVNTNLFSAGMRSGDTYIVIYGLNADLAHDHDDVNSPAIDTSRILLSTPFIRWDTDNASDGAQTLTVDYCEAADDSGSRVMKVTSGTSVTLASSGSVNQLDTGSVAANTNYALWEIMDIATPTTGYLLSTSFSSPTMPSGFTLKRLVGYVRTNGSSNIYSCTGTDNVLSWVTGGFPDQPNDGNPSPGDQLLNMPDIVDACVLYITESGDTLQINNYNDVGRAQNFATGEEGYFFCVIYDKTNVRYREDSAGATGTSSVNCRQAILDLTL